MPANVIINAGGTKLTLNGNISGTGASVTKIGGARVVFGDAAAVTYTGTTTISNGMLVVSATKTGGDRHHGRDERNTGGDGPITENVVFDGGGVSPGDADLVVPGSDEHHRQRDDEQFIEQRVRALAESGRSERPTGGQRHPDAQRHHSPAPDRAVRSDRR